MTQLTSAQEERMDLLIEEASEIIKEACKIKRFGFNSSANPFDEYPTNKEKLEIEIGGFAAVLQLAFNAGDLDPDASEAAMEKKQESGWKYTKYQRVETKVEEFECQQT